LLLEEGDNMIFMHFIVAFVAMFTIFPLIMND